MNTIDNSHDWRTHYATYHADNQPIEEQPPMSLADTVPRRFTAKSIKARNWMNKSIDNPLKMQVEGDHYKSKSIQPIEYIASNNLDFMEGSIVKYITRHKDKGGAGDVRKAIHYCQFILKYHYGES